MERISQSLAKSRKSFEDLADRAAMRSNKKKGIVEPIIRESPDRSIIDGDGRDVEGLSQVNSLAKTPVSGNRITPGEDGVSGISGDPMFIKVEKRMQEKQRELHA